MKKRILVLIFVCSLSIPFNAFAETTRSSTGAAIVADQLVTALTMELAGSAAVTSGGMLLGLLLYPVAGVIAYAEGVSGEQYFAGTAYYPFLAAATLFNPICASIGVTSVGRATGFTGTWRVPAYAYAATVPGLVALIAGYPRLAIPMLWVGPAVGATVGYHRAVRPLSIDPRRESSALRTALSIGAGSCMGGFSYWSARLLLPYVLDEPPIPPLELIAHSFTATPWEYAFVIPAATCYGAVFGARSAGSSVSWLATGAGALFGSALGWALSSQYGEDVNFPAVGYSMIGASVGALVSYHFRTRT